MIGLLRTNQSVETGKGLKGKDFVRPFLYPVENISLSISLSLLCLRSVIELLVTVSTRFAF